MNETIWHYVKEYDFPQPYKEVLIVEQSGNYTIGYYMGEANSFPWYVNNQGYTKSIFLYAWCELPTIKMERGD